LSEDGRKAFILLCGENPVKAWGITARERVRRMAAASGLVMAGDVGDGQFPLILVNAAFAFDPSWLRYILSNPGHVITFEGRPVLAHVAADPATANAIASAMRGGKPLPDLPDATALAFESGVELYNSELRKKERPFLLPLTLENVPEIERASYKGAYKGVTDFLTKYVWPELAFHITRFAAWIGLPPNGVTAVGAVLCVAATVLFFEGQYWLGLALGFIFMVLDTVDGKLARCTITSSKWGNIFDHGIDLIHPPFWWWAWGAGLSAYGRLIPQEAFIAILAVIVIGYILQRIIEGVFIRAYGMHIHVWRPADSHFRLVTARRNPNMAILFAFLLIGRPDLGLYAVAIWTVLSLLFHAARLAQAWADNRAGKSIESWLT